MRSGLQSTIQLLPKVLNVGFTSNSENDFRELGVFFNMLVLSYWNRVFLKPLLYKVGGTLEIENHTKHHKNNQKQLSFSSFPLSLLLHTLAWSRIPLLSSSGWCAGGGRPPLRPGGADPCDKVSSSSDSGGGVILQVSYWIRWRSCAVRLGARTKTEKHTHRHRSKQVKPLTLRTLNLLLLVWTWLKNLQGRGAAQGGRVVTWELSGTVKYSDGRKCLILISLLRAPYGLAEQIGYRLGSKHGWRSGREGGQVCMCVCGGGGVYLESTHMFLLSYFERCSRGHP